MGKIGGPELIIILVIVLLLFGGKKLPELARALGQSIREFGKAKNEGFSSVSEADANPPKAEARRAEETKAIGPGNETPKA